MDEKVYKNRDEILLRPENYIEKTVTMQLVLNKYDKNKSTVSFVPDMSKGVPLCKFVIFFKQIDKSILEMIKKRITLTYNVTFIITRVKRPTEPFGLQDYRNYVRGELIEISQKQ